MISSAEGNGWRGSQEKEKTSAKGYAVGSPKGLGEAKN